MSPELAVQLYTVRDAFTADPLATLKTLHDYGYRHVEPFGIHQWRDALGALSDLGLDAPATHANLLDEADASIEASAELGVQHVVLPSTPREKWQTADGVAEVADMVNALVDKVEAAGLTLGYHNHAFEFEHDVDGRPAYFAFVERLDPRIVLEVDTYWAKTGGFDPVELLAELGERVFSIPIKDGDGSADTTNQVAVGAGSLPVLDYMDAATNLRLGVVELDDTAPGADIVQATRDSFRFLTEHREWA